MLLLCSLTGLFAFLHILKATSYFINKLWQRSVTSWKNPLEAVSSGWIQPPPGNANLRKVPEALQASKMPLDERNTSESVINGTINFNKYSLLAEKWHKTSCNILGLAPLHLCQLGLWQGATEIVYQNLPGNTCSIIDTPLWCTVPLPWDRRRKLNELLNSHLQSSILQWTATTRGNKLFPQYATI